MNDITPPKQSQRPVEPAPAASDSLDLEKDTGTNSDVTTHVSPTHVGKPIRHWVGPAALAAVVVFVACVLVAGTLYIRRTPNRPRVDSSPTGETVETIGPKDSEGKKITNPVLLKKIHESQGNTATSTKELPR